MKFQHDSKCLIIEYFAKIYKKKLDVDAILIPLLSLCINPSSLFNSLKTLYIPKQISSFGIFNPSLGTN